MGQEWLLRVELCGGTWVSWQKAVVSSWSRGGEQGKRGLLVPWEQRVGMEEWKRGSWNGWVGQ